MSVDYRRLYHEDAGRYDALVSAEDAEGHLLPALLQAAETAGRTVVEVGAGTGRLTRLLAPVAGRIIATELSWPMVKVARARGGLGGAALCVADASFLPVRAACADVVVAGWVFGHFLEWLPGGWRTSLAAALAELRRVLRPGGTVVLLETLGTGTDRAVPPTPGLAEYYSVLEAEHGFRRRVVRTDYRFRSVEAAVELTGFFFGEELAEQVRRAGTPVVPEFTGIWSGPPPAEAEQQRSRTH